MNLTIPNEIMQDETGNWAKPSIRLSGPEDSSTILPFESYQASVGDGASTVSLTFDSGDGQVTIDLSRAGAELLAGQIASAVEELWEDPTI